MKRCGRLSTLDRVGIVILSILGTCMGLLIGLASDIRLTPAVALLFPGVLVGMIVARLFGITAGVLVCGVSNGAAYGFLLYGWCRLAVALRRNIPTWLAAVAAVLSHRARRR
jgi:hypothetical protein